MRSRTAGLSVRALILWFGLGLGAPTAWGGPKDTTTPFPVRIKIGTVEIKTVLAGGVPTISHDDAKALGILDANGDPTAGYPPDGETYLGNPKVKMHKYKKITIKVQGLDKDGNPTGEEIEVELRDVCVPVKPDNQYGGTDAERLRRSQEYKTKIVLGNLPSSVNGKKLVKKDEPTDDPKKNNRSTIWETPAPNPPPKKVAVDPAPDPDPADAVEPRDVRGVRVNGLFVEARYTDLPHSMIPDTMANLLGVVRTGETVTLSPEQRAGLASEGLLDALDDEPVTCEVGLAEVSLTHTDGTDTTAFASFYIWRPAFFDVFYIACGSNIHSPEGCTTWFDPELSEIRFTPTRCPADFDGDGFVSGDDFDQYVFAFENGGPAADFNGDGFVTGEDFDSFVAEFEAGCSR